MTTTPPAPQITTTLAPGVTTTPVIPDCFVMLRSGYVLDFTLLRPLNVHHFPTIGVDLYVCPTSATATPCGGGACNTNGSSLGNFVQSPTLLDDMVELRYTGGINGASTRIRFMCDMTKGLGSPNFVAINNNQYEFEWATALACADDVEPLECFIATANDSYYLGDLRLYGIGTNYQAYEVSQQVGRANYLYYINVCGPLITDVGQDLGDCRGAAACQLTVDRSHNIDTSSLFYNLGYPINEPTLDSHGNIVLQYTLPMANTGQMCKNSARRATTITFTCDPKTGVGEPVFDHEDTYCHYYFTWRTSFACPQSIHAGNISESQCTPVVSGINKVLNLTTVATTSFSMPLDREDGDVAPAGKYYLNVCQAPSGSHSKCPLGVGACVDFGDMVVSLGQLDTAAFTSSNGDILMTYSNGAPCIDAGLSSPNNDNSARLQTIVKLTCGNGIQKPVLQTVVGCTFHYSWSTPAACIATHPTVGPTPPPGGGGGGGGGSSGSSGGKSGSKGSAIAGGVIGALVAVVVVAAAVYYFRDPGRRYRVLKIFRRNKDPEYLYAPVALNEEEGDDEFAEEKDEELLPI